MQMMLEIERDVRTPFALPGRAGRLVEENAAQYHPSAKLLIIGSTDSPEQIVTPVTSHTTIKGFN